MTLLCFTAAKPVGEACLNAIVLLTHVPTRESLEFYSGFTRLGYQVFVVIDDNDFKTNIDDRQAYPQINVIQIDDNECGGEGFVNFNPVVVKKSGCSAWEKALYYICRQNNVNENVWFIEDDVFVPSYEAILKADRKYPVVDVLSAENEVNESGELGEWYWWRSVPRSFQPPWAKSMVCAVRLSREVLRAFDTLIKVNKRTLCIEDRHARLVDALRQKAQHLLRRSFLIESAFSALASHFPRKLFFIEYTFNTLALHNKLSVVRAEVLSGVTWRKEWDVSEMNSSILYHPVKDIRLHTRYRKILGERDA
jgi:hypothetical protein